MQNTTLTVEEAEHVHDVLADLAQEVGQLRADKARLEKRVAELEAKLAELKEEVKP